MNRPAITKQMNPEDFKDYYYLKDELINFCRIECIPTTGSKKELTDRIYHYVKTGEIKAIKSKKISTIIYTDITLETVIEEDITCSEVHREFFKKELGDNFKFKVAFQKWLKTNAGKKYSDAVKVYSEIANKKPDKIDSQFEYNTYVRDFFLENSNLTLKDAIKCWKYKKSKPGHNRYEKSDLLDI